MKTLSFLLATLIGLTAGAASAKGTRPRVADTLKDFGCEASVEEFRQALYELAQLLRDQGMA